MYNILTKNQYIFVEVIVIFMLWTMKRMFFFYFQLKNFGYEIDKSKFKLQINHFRRSKILNKLKG